jgi:hypothetical protein
VNRWIGLWLAAVALGCAPAALSPPATPAALALLAPDRTSPAITPAERRILQSGGTVQRPMRFTHGDGRYVGGVAHQLVGASPEEVVEALLTVPRLPLLLPRTKRASLVELRGNRSRVELTQGNSIVDATFTVYLERDPAAPVVRFWLDRDRPHDIADVWGFFRADRFDQTSCMVTTGVALDVGDDLVRALFEDRIQRAILSAPRQIRDHLGPPLVLAAAP